MDIYKNIINSISNMTTNEHKEILKILKNNNENYTENNNGIFILMKNISKKTIDEIVKFIEYGKMVDEKDRLLEEKKSQVEKNLKDDKDTDDIKNNKTPEEIIEPELLNSFELSLSDNNDNIDVGKIDLMINRNKKKYQGNRDKILKNYKNRSSISKIIN